jgi:hypothetical protein
MASLNGAPIKGKIIRLTQVDLCGVPITGASGRVMTMASFTKVEQAPQIEDGTEFFERTADGSLCVNQKDSPILKRMQLTVTMCSVDPDAAPMMLSARELTTTGPVSGTGFAVIEGASTSHFTMEVWQNVAGSGACDPTGLQRYIYNAWPHCLNVQLQNYTIENAKSELAFMCETQGAGPTWGHGPGSGPDTAKWLPLGAGGNTTTADHWLWNITTVAPPAAVNGFTTLT